MESGVTGYKLSHTRVTGQLLHLFKSFSQSAASGQCGSNQRDAGQGIPRNEDENQGPRKPMISRDVPEGAAEILLYGLQVSERGVARAG